METLILLRHAKAVSEYDAPTDRVRALSARGRAEAREAGETMAAHGLSIDRALVSTAERARETWARVAPCLSDPPATFLDTLYMADAETIWAEAARAGSAHVLIVGHNPGLHDLVATLVRQAHDSSRIALSLLDKMSPACWAAFAVTGALLRAAGPTLIGAWSPKSH